MQVRHGSALSPCSLLLGRGSTGRAKGHSCLCLVPGTCPGLAWGCPGVQLFPLSAWELLCCVGWEGKGLCSPVCPEQP